MGVSVDGFFFFGRWQVYEWGVFLSKRGMFSWMWGVSWGFLGPWGLVDIWVGFVL